MLCKREFKINIKNKTDLRLGTIGIIAFSLIETSSIYNYTYINRKLWMLIYLILIQFLAAYDLYMAIKYISRYFFKKKITLYGFDEEGYKRIIKDISLNKLKEEWCPLLIESNKGAIVVETEYIDYGLYIIENNDFSTFEKFTEQATIIKD